jgi:hypothetical protein
MPPSEMATSLPSADGDVHLPDAERDHLREADQ